MVAEVIADPPNRTNFGLRSLEWLMTVQTDPRDGHLSIIGNNGWMQRGGAKGPVRPAAHRCRGAPLRLPRRLPRLTGEVRWKAEMKKCFNWFLGANDLNMPSTTS